jgi:hypothetical protein
VVVLTEGVGQYSVTAKVTVVVTAACSVVTAALFLLYNTVMLKIVKRKHEKESGVAIMVMCDCVLSL